MKNSSVRQLGKILKCFEVSQEDGLAVLLTLESEENVQAFLAWAKSLDETPTGQKCFERAVEIAGILED